MPEEVKVNKSALRIVRDDLTNMEVDAVVFYAEPSLRLGSGFGSAIAVRGGPKIQEELNKIVEEKGEIPVCEAVATGAGNLNAKNIIHAVGPKFQEQDAEAKLVQTIVRTLERADEIGAKTVAFPPMGSGFYGTPLPVSARVTIDTIEKYLAGETQIAEAIICLLDNWEYKAFQEQLAAAV